MSKKIISWMYLMILFLFLYAPIAVLIAMSFNKSQYNSLPFEWSFRWYEALSQNTKLIDGTLNSVYIGLITSVICVLLATSLMYGYTKTGSKIRKVVDTVIVLPLTIPWIILGISLLLLLNALGLDKNYLVLIMGHVIISFPYAVLVIKARIQEMDLTITEASYTLGAKEMVTFIRIILPLIYPSMIAGGFLAFMISFDNFIISYFLIPIGDTVLPVEIYSSIKFGFTPEINAISAIIIALTFVIIIIIALIMKSSLKTIFKA